MIDAVVWFWTEAAPQFIDMTSKVSAVLISIVLAVVLVYFIGHGTLLLTGWLWAAWRKKQK